MGHNLKDFLHNLDYLHAHLKVFRRILSARRAPELS